MNTPITDAKSYPDGHDLPCVSANVARRLELDRAALMEALERATTGFHANTTGYFHVEPSDVAFAKAALAAARTNFPEQL